MRETWGLSEQSVVVSWLPLYHDMGLIGSALQSLYSGAHCVLMPPTAFLQNPLRWLRAITHYRGTFSCAPNFAFDLCVRKIPIEERAALDLSSWKVAVNGAEPLRNETLERFLEAFGGCGFRPETMNPGYGLAEATLFVSSSKVGSPLVFCDVRKSELEENRIVPVSQVDEESYRFISCGRVCGGQKLIIADPHTGAECLDGQIGEIWLSGASVARGYWNRAKETEETFGARTPGNGKRRFLRTGDLGFIRDGNLYIAGRLKDLIIIRGRNHYPQDIELTAEKSDPALRPGCGAAFTVDADGEERLVIAQEVSQTAIASLNIEDVVRKIRESVADRHEILVDHVALIKPGTISKTSSGKIQRRATRERYLNGGLEVISAGAISQPEDFKPIAGNQEARAAAGHGVGKRHGVQPFLFLQRGRRIQLGQIPPFPGGGEVRGQACVSPRYGRRNGIFMPSAVFTQTRRSSTRRLRC